MRIWAHFLVVAHEIPAQKFKRERGKQPVTRKIYEKKKN